MRIPAKKWLRQNGRWLRSRLTGGALILGYHRIAAVENDYFEMCVRPEHFEQQLAVIQKKANLIHMDHLVESLSKESLPPKSIVITFDDGYFDNLLNARPLLIQYQVPATMFVATGFFGRLFWWDELARIIFEPTALPADLELKVNQQNHRWQITGSQMGRTTLLQDIYQLLLPLEPSLRRDLLDRLEEWAVLPSKLDERSENRCMVEQEILQMEGDGLITIGAHTVSHPRLTDLSLKVQQLEIEQSKDCLEAVLGQPVTFFSYPNGDYSAESQALVAQAGFTAACASHNDVARPGMNPFQLPRFWVPDWDGERFGRWLDHWLAG